MFGSFNKIVVSTLFAACENSGITLRWFLSVNKIYSKDLSWTDAEAEILIDDGLEVDIIEDLIAYIQSLQE